MPTLPQLIPPLVPAQPLRGRHQHRKNPRAKHAAEDGCGGDFGAKFVSESRARKGDFEEKSVRPTHRFSVGFGRQTSNFPLFYQARFCCGPDVAPRFIFRCRLAFRHKFGVNRSEQKRLFGRQRQPLLSRRRQRLNDSDLALRPPLGRPCQLRLLSIRW